ncbi:hypothetical protein ACPOL_0874 [Acidisarcina polymorpha]|uniref:2-keto-3-deoxygluconate permease n=1 Tax=Acidisarcina polymorpha TaxID=2211140 RepID=A0A2Z5FTR4_9BACT|nr:2-keto-3-deoxygluconate permease [Acidisarcina polymorpha]AXC10231.1 hypothetical protein ACPOL_0874 [Acidisarcina polymorpha]
MRINIKRAVESVPGGMMIIPLICGAVVTTAAPHLAETLRIIHGRAVYGRAAYSRGFLRLRG